jgi:Ring finger domain
MLFAPPHPSDTGGQRILPYATNPTHAPTTTHRRRSVLLLLSLHKFWQAAGICLVLCLYLSLFMYMEGDAMSYESVVAVNTAGEVRVHEAQQEQVKVRRAQEQEEKAAARKQRMDQGQKSDRNDDDRDNNSDTSFWRILLFYMLLRFWLRSRWNENDDTNNHTARAATTTTGGAVVVDQAAAVARSRNSSQQPQQQQQRFRVWADRLNQQRMAQGQRPLSLDSLQLVLRERELYDGNDYDGLLQFHEEMQASALIVSNNNNNTGATPDEIDRLPLRVLESSDDLLNTTTTRRQTDALATSNCAVCLEAYRVGDQVRTIPCFHAFHKHCIDDWLSRKAECPICKHSTSTTALLVA